MSSLFLLVSIFRRKLTMWDSIVFEKGSTSIFQTCSSIMLRERTAPLFLSKYSSRLNSLGLRWISFFALHTVWVLVFKVRSFTFRTSPMIWMGRLNKARILVSVENLIELYQPRVLVLEDYAGKGSRRCGRVQILIDDTAKLALKKNLKVRRFSRAEIKGAFSESARQPNTRSLSRWPITFPSLRRVFRDSESRG